MNDDELGRALRALDPARTPADSPLPLDAERRLREIMDRPPVRRRRRPAVFITAAAAAVVVVLTILTGVFWMPAPPASALTPDPLSYRELSAGLDAVVADAQRRLADGHGPEEPERRSLSLGWYFSGSPDDAADTVFRREWVDLHWNADLSGAIVTTAAEATNAAGDTVPADGPAPGTLVSELTFVPGQYSTLSVDAPAPTREAMRDRLIASTGVGDAFTAGDAVNGIRRLLGEWTLTDAQEGALLQVVADAPRAHLLGETEDRLGRDVVGISGVPSAAPGYDLTLLVSRDTGRIYGVESTLRDDDPSLGLPGGSVTEYTLWNVDDRKDHST